MNLVLMAWGDDIHLDLRGEPVFRRDLGGDFEHSRDELFKGRRLGRQRQLVIRAPPDSGLAIPMRPDLESPSQPRHSVLAPLSETSSFAFGDVRRYRWGYHRKALLVAALDLSFNRPPGDNAGENGVPERMRRKAMRRWLAAAMTAFCIAAAAPA